MRRVLETPRRPHRRRLGYSLIEVVFAVGVSAVIFAAVFTGVFSGFSIIEVNRENLRASQILLEKTEMIRLYNWDQINNGWCGNPLQTTNASVPSNFIARYFEGNGAAGGLIYTGTVVITEMPATESYATHLRLVTVRLDWASQNIRRTRSITTFVSRYGLQNYIY